MIIDSHAHLHDKAFDDDRVEVLARAREAGVEGIINIGTDLADSARALALADEFGLSAALGIHPHEAQDAPEDIAAAFAALYRPDSRVAAIGEIGLDYYYDHSPRERQRDVLRAQLDVAARYDLPVIFHERDALDDFVRVLRDERKRRADAGLPQLRGVVHCFTRDEAAARLYTEEFGLYLGIGGVLTFKTAQPLRDAVAAVGLNSLILETDCPYLAPVPHRGKRNEPAFITQTAQKLSEVLALSPETVLSAARANTCALFGTAFAVAQA